MHHNFLHGTVKTYNDLIESWERCQNLSVCRLYNHIKSRVNAKILQSKMINSETGLTGG